MIALLLAAAVAASPQQFDLVCTGTKTEMPAHDPETQQPWSSRFRVDLEAHIFCQGRCVGPRQLYNVEADKISLSQTDNLAVKERQEVDRLSGRYYEQYLDRVSLELYKIEATCERADFTPIPASKF